MARPLDRRDSTSAPKARNGRAAILAVVVIAAPSLGIL